MSLIFNHNNDVYVGDIHLHFKHICDGGDATSTYAIEFERGLTIRKLVDIVLKYSPDEWGYIKLKDPYKRTEVLSYDCGKITQIDDALFEKVADIEIKALTAQGGYSRMDYIAAIPETVTDAATDKGGGQ